MNAQKHPSDDIPPHVLAAFVDGELDQTADAWIEQWLSENPRAAEALEVQQRFSPSNRFLWDSVEPDAPSIVTWARLQANIHEQLSLTNRRRSRLGKSLWLAATAAGILLGVLALQRTEPAQRPAMVASEMFDSESSAVLPIATERDVEIESLRGYAWHALPIGVPHVTDSLELAAAGDVRLEGTDSLDWPNGEPQIAIAPGDAAVLYAIQTEAP